MANEIRQYSLTIPAGTAKAAPVSLDCTMPPREVVGLQIVVPNGCNGAVGFQVQNSGLAIIPYGSDTWLIASGETIPWDLADYINSGSWQVAGYNLGTNDHTLRFRFLCNYLTAAAAPGIGTEPIAANDLIAPAPADDGSAAVDELAPDDIDLTLTAG